MKFPRQTKVGFQFSLLFSLMSGLLGCQQGWNTADDTGGDTTDTQFDTDELDDRLVPLERCEGYTDEHGEFFPIPGATVWWFGELSFAEDGSVAGSEWAEIRPNARWIEVKPEDALSCRLPYQVVGTVTHASSVQYELLMDGFVNLNASTCSPTITTDLYGRTMSGIRYSVRLNCAGGPSDGESCDAVVDFAPSGNDFAAGVADANGLAYESTPGCQFF